VRTQGLQVFFCNALHAQGFSKAYESFAMHSVLKASKACKSFCNALCAQGFQGLQVFCNALHVQDFQGLHDFHNALRPKSYKSFTMHCIE
jgi:YHS domain-containing protein